MMTTCPICGTRRVVFWPEHWVYRRGDTYYCSENCMMVDETKDMKLIKMIAHVRAQKGSRAKMARMKKDGTPAKKPGPKKRIEVPETCLMIPSDKIEIGPISAKAVLKPLDVVAVKSRQFNGLVYRKEKEYMKIDFGDPISFEGMRRQDWAAFCEEVMTALDQLGVEL